MKQYINTHAILDAKRAQAKEAGDDSLGPRVCGSRRRVPCGDWCALTRRLCQVLVVGPTDSGKSTLCRVLINYAIRRNTCPTYVRAPTVPTAAFSHALLAAPGRSGRGPRLDHCARHRQRTDASASNGRRGAAAAARSPCCVRSSRGAAARVFGRRRGALALLWPHVARPQSQGIARRRSVSLTLLLRALAAVPTDRERPDAQRQRAPRQETDASDELLHAGAPRDSHTVQGRTV